MKNKKRIVCYGDSNTWGYDIRTQKRFNDYERWTSLLQENLGSEYIVQEEGLNGRTTVFTDPLNEGLNGLEHLPTILKSHDPINTVVLMLGTNDCKQRYSATPENIADGLEQIIIKAKSLDVWESEPKILVVAPVTIQSGCYSAIFAGEMGAGCVEKSEKLPRLFKKKAKMHKCLFWDCNEKLTASAIDHMHLDENAGQVFAEHIAGIVRDSC